VKYEKRGAGKGGWLVMGGRLLDVSLNTILGSICFLEQETLRSLLKTRIG